MTKTMRTYMYIYMYIQYRSPTMTIYDGAGGYIVVTVVMFTISSDSLTFDN